LPNIQGQAANEQTLAAIYVDGFNLYHAIRDLGQSHLKWVNLWQLGQIIIPQQSQRLVGAVLCTAVPVGRSDKGQRHHWFIDAQRAYGVEVVRGHFIGEPLECRACRETRVKDTEKEGDINVALHIMRDAVLDKADHFYLLSADSDQAATVRMFRTMFPAKVITAVVPPGREPSTHLAQTVNGGTIQLSELHLERSVMPQVVLVEGHTAVRRPHQYTPPEGWVHPDNRPARR